MSGLNITKYSTKRKNLFLNVATGHFAGSNSHSNYFIDVVSQKSCLSEARAVAKELCSDYYYHNTPMKSLNADYIVINHGTNDGLATAEEFVDGYIQLLKLIRSRNPQSKIAVIIPFYGRFRDEFIEFIPNFNKENEDNLFLVDTYGWLPKEPVHPSRDGHKYASLKLIEALRDWI